MKIPRMRRPDPIAPRPISSALSLLAFFLASVPASAQSAPFRPADASYRGGTAGNGGSVVQCGDKVRLADFFELELRPGLRGKLPIRESDEPVDEQVRRAFDRLKPFDPALHELALREWGDLKNGWLWIEGEYEWAPTDDIGPYPLPPGCGIKNAILYFRSGYKEVQKALFEALSPTHQAGILAHEVVFKIIRDRSGEQSSVPARRITALLFSENRDAELLGSLVARYMYRKDQVFLIEEGRIDWNFSESFLQIDAYRRQRNRRVCVERGVCERPTVCVADDCETLSWRNWRWLYPLRLSRAGTIHRIRGRFFHGPNTADLGIVTKHRGRFLGLFPETGLRFRAEGTVRLEAFDGIFWRNGFSWTSESIFAILSRRMNGFLEGHLP